MTVDPIEEIENDYLKPFSSWQEIRTALAQQDTKSMVDACHRLKAHLRSLFKKEDPNVETHSLVITEYLEKEPDLTQIWTIFQFTLSFRNLYPLIMDILGLFLSIPIQLQTYKQPLFLYLLKNFKPVLLSKLQTTNQFKATVSTLRTFTFAVQAGLIQDVFEHDFFLPFPKLATSVQAQLHRHHSKKKNYKQKKEEPTSKSKLVPLSLRQFYIQYISALIHQSEIKLRQSMLDNLDFLRPLLKDLEFDSTETLQTFFSALQVLIHDPEISKTSKITLFSIAVLENIKKLYSEDETKKKELAHTLLHQVCTIPGQVLCFKDYGIYPPPSYSLCNKQLSIFIFKLNVLDPNQQELMFHILKSCPELVPFYSERANVSLDPKDSARWFTTVQFVLKLLELPFPSFQTDVKQAVGHHKSPPFPSPPPFVNVLAHIAPLASFHRDIFARGFSMSSPLVMFFSARLLISILTNVQHVLNQLNQIISSIEMDPQTMEAWILLRAELITETSKQAVDFQVIFKCLHFILEYLPSDQFPTATSTPTAPTTTDTSLLINSEEQQVRLEKEPSVQPSMIYLCMLRILSIYAHLFPEHMTLFDTGKLLSILPPLSLMEELLDTLVQWPPLLTSKSLSILLRLHASKSFLKQTSSILETLLARSSLFVQCPNEIQWWLLEFPTDVDFLVFFTNLFGESTQHVFSLQDTLKFCNDQGQVHTSFSCFTVALVQKLSKTKDTLPLSVYESCISILQRIRASLTSTAPFQALLEFFDPTWIVPEPNVHAFHPYLMASQFLQTLATLPVIHQMDVLNSFHEVLVKEPLSVSFLCSLFSHPQLKYSMSTLPLEIIKLLQAHLVPFISDPSVASLMDDYLACLVRMFSETKQDLYCEGLVSLLGTLKRTISFDWTVCSPHQGLSLAPYMTSFLPESFKQWLESSCSTATLSTHQFILNTLLSTYPLLHRPLSLTPPSFHLNHIPECYVLHLLSLDFALDPCISDLLHLFMLYSKSFYLTCLQYIETTLNSSSGLPDSTEKLFKLLVSASAIVTTQDFQLQWLPHASSDRVLQLAQAHFSNLFAHSLKEEEEDVLVTLVLLTAYHLNQENLKPTLKPSLTSFTLVSLVRGWHTCSNENSKLTFLELALEQLVNHHIQPDFLVPKEDVLSFLLSMLNSVPSIPNVFGTFGLELMTALVRFHLELSMELLLRLLPSFVVAHPSGQIDVLLTSLFDALGSSMELKLLSLQAISFILSSAPELYCKQEYLFKLISNYTARLQLSDVLIFDLFQLFEHKANTNLGPLLLFWGPAAERSSTLVDASFSLIDASIMSTTVQHFPPTLHLKHTCSDVCPTDSWRWVSSTKQLLHTKQELLYDPRFFLFLTFKYLEQGNSIDLQVLVEKHLIGLAIVALSSEDLLMRNLGLRVLDEFYALIDTSELEWKPSLSFILDTLKFLVHQRGEGSPKFSRLISTFLALSLPILAHPEHVLYERLHMFLLSKPVLETDHFPFLRIFLSSSSKAERSFALSLLESCSNDPLIRSSLWDWLFSLVDQPTLAFHHHRSLIQCFLQWSFTASHSNLVSSALIPYFTHFIYTSRHPRYFLMIARSLAIVYLQLKQQGHQQLLECMAQAMVRRCQQWDLQETTITTSKSTNSLAPTEMEVDEIETEVHESKEDGCDYWNLEQTKVSLLFCFNVLEALIRINQSPIVLDWANFLLSKIDFSTFPVSKRSFQLPKTNLTYFKLFPTSLFANFSMLETEESDLSILIETCVVQLAPFSRLCNKIAISTFDKSESLLHSLSYH